MKRLFPFSGLALAGCLHIQEPEPKVVTVTADKPVAVSCVPPGVADAPTSYVDAAPALRALDGPGREQLLIAGRLQRDARLGVLEPVIAGCRKATGQ